MEESKERVFYGGVHVAGMCHSSHAKWRKGYFLMKLKELVRGPHREHGMASMPEGQSDRWVVSKKDFGWGHSSRESRGRCQAHLAPEGFLPSRSKRLGVSGGRSCLLTQALTEVP